MPNWCEGTFKVRGTKEDVRKFLLEALIPIPNGFFEQMPAEKIVEEEISYSSSSTIFSAGICSKNPFGIGISASNKNFLTSSFVP
ncbi:hypothetical protein P4H99_30010, partial [Bacillus cereus]|nr:hypothetical protein [Bacillus cereus]